MVDHCSPKSIEDELAIAHRAVKEGDLGHAAFHIAAALVVDPPNAEVLAVFDAWFSATDNPLELVSKRDDKHWVGWSAMQARAHARLGHVTEALPLIAELAAFAPHKGYLTWLGLIRNVGQVPDEVARSASQALLRLASSLKAPLSADDPARASAEAALALLAEWRETKRGLPEPLHALSILLRKLGRTSEALTSSRMLFELRPDWRSAGTLCTTLRIAGDLEAALAIAGRCVELAPFDSRAASFLDVGDLCLELRRPRDARHAYAAALELEPENTWARAGFLFARFGELGDDADRAALRNFVLEHPDDAHACGLLSEIGEPLLDRAVWPSDAMANGFRHIHQSSLERPPIAPTSPSAPLKVSLAMSAPESPSNILAGELMARAFGMRLELELSVSDIPAPDPREPLPGAELALWRRAGDSFEAALELPEPAVQREVSAIAASPYNLAAWMERARILGEAVGPAGVRDLLATMVHPPELPNRHFDAPLWVQNVQIAATAAIAHVDRGWDGSTRRATLLSLGRGPVDWSVTAAIVALMWIAMHERRAVAEIEALFQELRRRETRSAGCTYDVPLRQAWLRIPDISVETRAMLVSELDALLSDVDATPVTALQPSPPKSGSWRIAALAWAIGLSGVVVVPRIWPSSWGEWALPSLASVGVAFWIWARQVRPRQRR